MFFSRFKNKKSNKSVDAQLKQLEHDLTFDLETAFLKHDSLNIDYMTLNYYIVIEVSYDCGVVKFDVHISDLKKNKKPRHLSVSMSYYSYRPSCNQRDAVVSMILTLIKEMAESES